MYNTVNEGLIWSPLIKIWLEIVKSLGYTTKFNVDSDFPFCQLFIMACNIVPNRKNTYRKHVMLHSVIQLNTYSNGLWTRLTLSIGVISKDKECVI